MLDISKDHNLKQDIEKFIRSLGSGSLAVFGGEYEGGIYLQQIPDEIASCIVDVINIRDKGRFKNYLEIGAASGGATYLFNHFFNWDNVLLIDDNQHKYRHWCLRENILKHIKHEEFIGDSHTEEAFNFAKRFMFDLIFIDGDHTYEGVKKDIEMYLGLLNVGGLVLFHDTLFDRRSLGVKRAFEELKADENFKFINEYVSKTKRKLGLGLLQRIK